MTHSPLPPRLGQEFSVSDALALGIAPGRLRGRDLEAPFRGVRMAPVCENTELNRFERARERELRRIRALACRLTEGQFFSHRSAALLWGAPLPHHERPEIHLSTVKPQRAPRIAGVAGHCSEPARAETRSVDGISVSSPAITYASLGALPVPQLVAVGDFLARKYRRGYGRPQAGRPPLATLPELGRAVDLGRWNGSARIRAALSLVREDSWSPRESITRVVLVSAGLPEPSLNVDIYDGSGRFLACVDMAYLKYRVIVEYQGDQHGERYAEDVERFELLRADLWDVIQVTRVLARSPSILVRRVAAALRAGGWNGEAA